jgi:putative cell wall-binding protein/Tol biopolymer transport system component
MRVSGYLRVASLSAAIGLAVAGGFIAMTTNRASASPALAAKPISYPIYTRTNTSLLLGSAGTLHVAAAPISGSIPIAYDNSSTGPVEVVDADGSNAHQLGPAAAYSPTWKSDGSALAMSTFDGANLTGLAVVSAAGEVAAQEPVLARNPTYSPDGTRLMYWNDQPSGKELISIANADGSDPRVVWDDTKGMLSADLGFLPQWAPDGSAVVFNTFPAGCTWCLESGSPNQVWIVDADGTGLRHVANGDGIEHVRWSPDGQWLVGDGLLRVRPDGTSRSQLGSGGGSAPVWSPDGAQIAYIGGPASTAAVSIANADGSNPHVVVNSADPASSTYSDVQWLPDGSGLVFDVQTDDPATNNQLATIETVGADGSGLRTIATGQNPVVPTYVTRLAGATRDDTAVSVSRATFTVAPTIVVARDDLYPDALAGGPLAAKVHGPLLLSPPTGVTPALAAEAKRLGAKTADLIGDTTALSANVEAGLRAAGITTINRIGGPTRYDTARLIADKVGGTAVYIARGDNFPDAASVAGLAAFEQHPILLTPPGFVAVATTAALSDLNATSACIIGGTNAISSSVQSKLAALGLTVSRVSGPTRYGTSAAVATLADEAGMTGAPWLADGANWPDALSAGPAAAAVKGNLLLVDSNSLDASPETRDRLITHLPTTVVAVGGPDVVSPADAAHALAGS